MEAAGVFGVTAKRKDTQPGVITLQAKNHFPSISSKKLDVANRPGKFCRVGVIISNFHFGAESLVVVVFALNNVLRDRLVPRINFVN